MDETVKMQYSKGWIVQAWVECSEKHAQMQLSVVVGELGTVVKSGGGRHGGKMGGVQVWC